MFRALSALRGRPVEAVHNHPEPSPPPPSPGKKGWEAAQEYELDHACGFMSEPYFVDLFEKFRRGELQTSTGYRNELFLREFFDGNRSQFDGFLQSIQGKACLDVGPCVFSPLVTWDGIGDRYAIEPLGNSVRDWQEQRFGISVFDRMILRSVGADVFLADLVGKIDGVIHCRNMLDHTPNWAFVLSNLATYAARGCHLLFWTDIDHRGTADEGHFDICKDAGSLKRMIEQLGFNIEREFSDTNRHEANWGCVAIKR